MSEPITQHFPGGIPELGIPAGAHVFLWISQRRYAFYVERNEYDHGVIFNHIMQDHGTEVIPGPGVVDHLRLAMTAGSPSGTPPTPSPRAPVEPPLRLVRDQD